MAATRENVLAEIARYVEEHKRRAPAKEIASALSDTIPNVQAIIKTLVSEGAVSSSRGRNGGALPDGMTLPEKKSVKVKVEQAAADESPAEDNAASEFAALLAKMEASEAVEDAADDLFAHAP